MPAPGSGNPGVPMFWAIKGGGTTIKNTMSQMQDLAMVGNEEKFFMDTSSCVLPSRTLQMAK